MIGHDSVISIHFNIVNIIFATALLKLNLYVLYSIRIVYLSAADALMVMRSDREVCGDTRVQWTSGDMEVNNLSMTSAASHTHTHCIDPCQLVRVYKHKPILRFCTFMRLFVSHWRWRNNDSVDISMANVYFHANVFWVMTLFFRVRIALLNASLYCRYSILALFDACGGWSHLPFSSLI